MWVEGNVGLYVHWTLELLVQDENRTVFMGDGWAAAFWGSGIWVVDAVLSSRRGSRSGATIGVRDGILTCGGMKSEQTKGMCDEE
jgi:hypothetical protein